MSKAFAVIEPDKVSSDNMNLREKHAAAEAIILKNALANRIRGQISIIIPIILVGILAHDSIYQDIFWSLLALLILGQIAITFTSIRLKRNIENGHFNSIYTIPWMLSEAISASIVISMIIPCMYMIDNDKSAMTILIILTATLTSIIILSASVKRLVIPVMIGAIVTSVAAIFYFNDIFNSYYSIVILVIPLGLWLPATIVSKQAHKATWINIKNKSLTISLEHALEHTEHLSRHDSLTGLLNRRAFLDTADIMHKSSEQSVCVMLLDVDHFKRINDTYGHCAGDKILKSISHQIVNCYKPTSNNLISGRWGGEEFIIAIDISDQTEAKEFGQRLLKDIEAKKYEFDGKQINITASAGLVSWIQNENIEKAISRSDKALYEAKARGRNRAIIA